ncbi:hypothetical protein QBC33DRAFT_610651 [Phialemonium atrogriseum]|uniref:FAR1 domain-containing protein n=1 Tax=Phialemonium atrogriseum TaxID=1093897 RepID=A0AAJ0C198_9PEZI|nr:uncharacterized protein QBC33DRAFT_610651 [Phialemonium atrogriseum]KAK1768100.1 hypothetical protein QBC33DRAFT_610651 [Phialemonium atrogriseum]
MAAPTSTPALLPPPEDRLYTTFQDLHEDIKAWGRAQGYAMGLYRRYNLSCSKGGKEYQKKGAGLRQGNSHKTGCRMRVKCIQNRAWPWNDRWHVQVLEGAHNHGPFTGEAGEAVPPQFRKLDPDGIRWLLIMHREAKCNLRQLTIGLRVSFGDKYQFVKKSDVSNMLAKIKRGEEKEIANRPPGAPPLPPGAMTAFTAAVLNPVSTPSRAGPQPQQALPDLSQYGPPQHPQHPQHSPHPQHPQHAQHAQHPQHPQPQHPQPPHAHPQQAGAQQSPPQQPQQPQRQRQWQTQTPASMAPRYGPPQPAYQPPPPHPQGQAPPTAAGAQNQPPAPIPVSEDSDDGENNHDEESEEE